MRKGQRKGQGAGSTGIRHLYLRVRGGSRLYFVRVKGREKYLEARDLPTAKVEMHSALAELHAKIARAEAGPITADELHYERASSAQAHYDKIAADPLTEPTSEAFLTAFELVVDEGFPESNPLSVVRERAVNVLRERGIEPDEGSIQALWKEWINGIKIAREVWEHRAPRPALPSLPPRSGSPEALEAHVEDWLATLNTEETSKAMARRTIAKLAGELHRIADVTPEKVQSYVNRLLRNGLKLATVKRNLSELRGYWHYLVSLGLAPKEVRPFDGLVLPRASKKGRDDGRKGFEPADVVKLLREAENRRDHDLANLIRLAMWTGARREELCSLKVGNVKDDCIWITDAKSKAGVRQVPIHFQLKQTLHRLIEGRPADAYVLRNLRTTKYDDRGDAIGKRFTRLKRSLGFGDQHVFHSIRRTVTTMLDRAGVRPGVTDQLLGWERKETMRDHYTDDALLSAKREAIEKLAYPTIGIDAGT